MTMMLTTYLASLSPLALLRSLPGACAQGLIWGLLALGVYITYKLLDFADLTVDGSMATGGAVAVMLIRAGMNPWLALIFAFLAGMAAGFITGMLHTALGIPGILASILTQISLYSINLNILEVPSRQSALTKTPLLCHSAIVRTQLQAKSVCLRPVSSSALYSLPFSIGISEQSRDMRSVQPAVTGRWQERRESTLIFIPYLH